MGQGLGGGYRRLWTASAVSTLGDGMYLAAWLPFLVGAAVLALASLLALPVITTGAVQAARAEAAAEAGTLGPG